MFNRTGNMPESSGKVQHLLAMSSNRDRSIYPNPSRYAINFADYNINQYKIASLRITGAVLPNTSSIQGLPYVLVALEELDQRGFFLPSGIASIPVLGVLQLDRAFGNNAFLNAKGDLCRIASVLNPFSGNVNRLTLQLLDPTTGLPIDFGSDNGATVDPTLQNTICFEITSSIE